MSPKRPKGGHGEWISALMQQKLEVRSATASLQPRGWLDTGNYALNWAISGRLLGGYPLGHCIEIFGDPSTGKSFLVARALAMVQAMGGVALLDDTEGAYNLEHATALGVHGSTLAYRRSRTVKEHLDTAVAFIQAYRELHLTVPGVLACDSLAQLSTEHELETKLDRRDMTKAAELKAFYRIVGGDLLDLPVIHLAANHTIAAIGSLFQTRTTPGGGGPKFQASVRLDLRATSKIKSGANYIGTICRVVVAKNRIAAPWKEVRLAIPFERPVARASGLVPLLLALGVFAEEGRSLTYRGEQLARVAASKDHFLDQDAMGEQIIVEHPAILADTDAMLATAAAVGAPQAEAIAEEEEE